MKHRHLLESLATFGVLLASLFIAAPASAVEVGQAAPLFALPTADSEIKLASLKGKVVYVDFWASWCGPCRQSFPWMNELMTKYPNLKIVGVNVDAKREDAYRFLDKTPARFDVVFDSKGETPTAYGAKGMPTSYLIGADGKVLAVHTGFNPGDVPELDASIKKALAAAR
jgi:thiol-disulfide isomerase/thioredoxin